MRLIFLLSSLCLCVALCACGRSTPTYYYVLESTAATAVSGDLPATSLRVAPVSVPQYLDRTGLVRHGAQPENLTVEESHQWAEPLAEGIRRVVQAELAAPLRGKGVHVLANADDSDSTYTLFIQVERLEAVQPGTVRLVAQWRCDRNGRTRAQGIFAENRAVEGEGVTAQVQAQSALVRQLAAWIEAQLPNLGKAGGGKRS